MGGWSRGAIPLKAARLEKLDEQEERARDLSQEASQLLHVFRQSSSTAAPTPENNAKRREKRAVLFP